MLQITTEYQVHELAAIFPPLPNAQLKQLAASIKEVGLLQPIVLFDDKVLDGVHRQKACAIANVEPRYETYAGDDPLGFVLAANVERRHLISAQRASVADELATLPHGGANGNGNGKSPKGLSLKEAAKAMGVGISTVKRARELKQNAPRPIQNAIFKDGLITLGDAYAVRDVPADEQLAALKVVRGGTLPTLKAALADYFAAQAPPPPPPAPEPQVPAAAAAAPQTEADAPQWECYACGQVDCACAAPPQGDDDDANDDATPAPQDEGDGDATPTVSDNFSEELSEIIARAVVEAMGKANAAVDVSTTDGVDIGFETHRFDSSRPITRTLELVVKVEVRS